MHDSTLAVHLISTRIRHKVLGLVTLAITATTFKRILKQEVQFYIVDWLIILQLKATDFIGSLQEMMDEIMNA